MLKTIFLIKKYIKNLVYQKNKYNFAKKLKYKTNEKVQIKKVRSKQIT